MRSPLLGTVLLVAGTAFALAQETAQPAAPSAPAATQPSPDATPAGKPSDGKPATLAGELKPTFVEQKPEDRVASKLVGLTIQNGAAETIGEIADIVLDEGNTVKAWIVGVGGFVGIGTKYVAIDPSALTLVRDDKTLKATIATTKDQLRAAPEYVYLGKEKPKDAAATTEAGKPR